MDWCREVLWEEGADGRPVVTGLRLSKAGKEEVVTADAYVAALDVPGAKRLIPPAWRRLPLFDNLYKLVGVPVITVQLRYILRFPTLVILGAEADPFYVPLSTM